MRTLKPNETQIQKALVNLQRLAGKSGSMLAHIPNGEKRDVATASKLKAVNYRQLKQAASEPSYAATGTLNDPRPIPGQKPKAL